jgi:alpha-glucosidase
MESQTGRAREQEFAVEKPANALPDELDREKRGAAGYCWWQTGTIYQIYPRSFQDSNGDGIGDLQGIVERLDYLVWLGIDAIWISPFYASPMKDFGYDVSDHTAIDPMFGTLADFDRLVEETHRRGMKLIMDFVPNHTSDQHPWFIESRSSRNSELRDWYIWRDPAPDDGPPNNWLSNFGGSGWTLDEATGQYYYHAFLKEQPDLNWRNAEMRAAQYDVLRFWFDRGVDGFRIDVVWHLIKDDEFRDNPINPDYRPGAGAYSRLVPLYVADRPEIHDVLLELRNVADEYADRVLIGEIYLPVERLVAYYGRDLRGLHLPFNFQLIEGAWNARGIEQIIRQYESLLPGGAWPNWVLGNHDKPRIATRVSAEQARVAAVLLLTLRGTPTLYFGDELGMQDVIVPFDQRRDPCGLNPEAGENGRDPCRTPMQWDSSPNSGFSSSRPWLPLGRKFAEINVAYQARCEGSMLGLYRRLLKLRKEESALTVGSVEMMDVEGDVLAYSRRLGESCFLVALNLGNEEQLLDWHKLSLRGRIVLSSDTDRAEGAFSGRIALRANEAIIVKLHRTETEMPIATESALGRAPSLDVGE